jgi:hypothetical protein
MASWAVVPTPPPFGRRRLVVALIGVVVLVVIGVGSWALFLRDDGGSDGEEAGPSGTKVVIPAGEVVSENVAAPAAFPEDQRNIVVKQVRRYVDVATVKPLRSARPAQKLNTVFDAGAMAAVQGPDGEALLDEGLPKVTGKLTARSAPVAINALADASGAWVLASARIDLDVEGSVDDGTLRIARQGELLFVPDAGNWKIAAFDVFVERKGPGVSDGDGKGKGKGKGASR